MLRPLITASTPQTKAPPKPVPGSAFRKLWPYIWPAGRPDLTLRIFASVVLLLVAKVITIAVPFSFKWATDAMSDPARASLSTAIASPLAFTLLYGGLRILMALLSQARDAIFADVAMHAVRRLARDVFSHLHLLSLRFHLERKTGGLTRILERGRNSIETIVRTTMLTAVPTIVEFVLILAVFLYQFDWRYAAVVSLMILAYMGFTTAATNWRIAIRRAMNESDTDANTKAIDSLLNFETVKYYNAEAREEARYDKSIARYERMSIKTYTSLAFLNAGQAVIFTCGLTAAMAMSIEGIKSGAHTVGDFVLINAMMIQLYQPLNFMGVVYREIRQAAIDIEMMFAILGQHPEVEDRPGAKPLAVTKRPAFVRTCVVSLRPSPANSEGREFRRSSRQNRGDCRSIGGRQIHVVAPDFPFLRAFRRANHDRWSGYFDLDPNLAASGDRRGSTRHGTF